MGPLGPATIEGIVRLETRGTPSPEKMLVTDSATTVSVTVSDIASGSRSHAIAVVMSVRPYAVRPGKIGCVVGLRLTMAPSDGKLARRLRIASCNTWKGLAAHPLHAP